MFCLKRHLGVATSLQDLLVPFRGLWVFPLLWHHTDSQATIGLLTQILPMVLVQRHLTCVNYTPFCFDPRHLIVLPMNMCSLEDVSLLLQGVTILYKKIRYIITKKLHVYRNHAYNKHRQSQQVTPMRELQALSMCFSHIIQQSVWLSTCSQSYRKITDKKTFH